jgi:hypothetical protein
MSLILPSHVQAQRQSPPPPPSAPGFDPQFLAELKPFFQDAKNINDAIALLVSRGEAAFHALIYQPEVIKILQQYLHSICPRLTSEVASKDRGQVLSAMKQLMDDRIARSAMRQEKLDVPTYQAALADFHAICSQLPLPALSVNLQLPVLDTLPEDTQPPTPLKSE